MEQDLMGNAQFYIHRILVRDMDLVISLLLGMQLTVNNPIVQDHIPWITSRCLHTSHTLNGIWIV